MPTLAFRQADLKYEVGRLLNWGPPSEWTTEDNEDYKRIFQAALLKFYRPPIELTGGDAYEWSFLVPAYRLTCDAPYSTGTITVSSGVVTLSGGTFPSWAADGELYISGQSEAPYEVSTRDSGTQVTLVDTDVDVTTASGYTLARYQYSLPSNFGWFLTDLTFRPVDRDYMMQAVEAVTYDRWLELKQNWNRERDFPRYFTTKLARTQEEGSSVSTDYSDLRERRLLLWPTPDAAYYLTSEYHINMQTLDVDEVLGADLYPEVIRLLTLAEAEVSKDHPTPKYQQQAYSALAAAVQLDKRSREKTSVLGYSGDDTEGPATHYSSYYYPYSRIRTVTHENQ